MHASFQVTPSRSPVDRLSDLMRDAAASGGGVTADELAALGVSAKDIAQHATAAAQRASRLSVRRITPRAA